MFDLKRVFEEMELSLYEEDWKFEVEGLLEDGPPNAASKFAREDLLDKFKPNSDSSKGELELSAPSPSPREEKSLFLII